MNEQIFDSYLNALYLKSKQNLRNGFDSEVVARLIGLDSNSAHDVIYYLKGKNYVDTKNNYGRNISLTTQGIDYVLELHKNKRFKTIRFKEAQYVPPASKDVIGFMYRYELIDADGRVENKTITISVTDVLNLVWNLTWHGKGHRDAEKILLHYAKNTIIKKIKENTLNEHEELVLNTSNEPNTCPVNSENLIDTKSAEFEVEIVSKPPNEVALKHQHMPNINKIQLSTRRNILDSFQITTLPWYGDMEQQIFLGRFFDLSILPSYDGRFTTASEDIYKHTVMNNDWPDEWVFTDSRFNLLHISDEQFLDFICFTIHPNVRKENDEIITLLEIYNNNLKKEGISIEKTSEIAGHAIYSARELQATSIITTATMNLEVRKALVIGCSTYVYAPKLQNPINDANGMESTLLKLGFEVTKLIDPSQKELKITIDEFGEILKESDVGLFYFAGHGAQVKGLNYLIPVDANLTSEKIINYDCVEANRILIHMEDARTSINLIILDACRDNPFERNWARGISQRGLATMDAPKGTLISYSTAPGQTASDGYGKNGLYTESLLNHIESKSISANNMLQNVRSEVVKKSNGAQVPWEATSLTGDFFFNK